MDNQKPNYLLVGHVSHDLTPEGAAAGGTAVYAGRTAQLLGCHTAVYSSAATDFDWEQSLPGMPVVSVPAEQTTTFANVYSEKGRQQTIHAVAARLTAVDLPPAWQQPAIVHLAPIAQEVDPALITLFSDSLVGLTPQGWLRCWQEDGRVYPCEWLAAAQTLPLAAAVILSREDLNDLDLLDPYRQWARLVVVTEGANGCTVYCRDESRHIPAPVVTEVDATGAGDIFAAAFLVRLYQTGGNPWEAAQFANKLAAYSVTQRGLESKMQTLKEIVKRKV